MPSLADLEGYAGDTSSSLLQLAAIVLAGGRDPGTAEAAGHAGVALTVTGRLRTLGRDASERRLFLPADIAARHGLDLDALFAGAVTPELRAFLAEMRAVARRHLAAARAALSGTDPAVLPAFLPLTLIEAELRRMEKVADPLRDAGSVAPFRRQFALWRAARRGRV
jgi:phytoene synthase